MARARNIKPSFFQNEELGELDPAARLFFIGLWTVADYRGCVEFRPKRLKVQLLPYDECSTETLANNLERSGFIKFYSVGGQRYLKIINFEKHQNPHKNERESGSEIPDIDQDDSQTVDSIGFEKNPEQDGTNPEQDGTDPADSLLLIPDSPIPLPEGSAPPATPATPAKESKSTRATQIHEAFYPDETGVTLADSLSIPFASELEKFRDYHKARGKPMKDWQAAWRTWARNAAQFAKDRGGNRQPFITEKQRRDDATTRAIFGSLMPAMTNEKVIEHEPATSIRLD